jgi:hypothetical protein
MQRDDSPSTAEERSRIVAIAPKIQANPLDKSLLPEAEQLMIVLIKVPDIHVSVCGASLPWFGQKKYKYGGDLMRVAMLNQGAYAIQHPQEPGDSYGQQLAALTSVLRGYEVLVKQDPSARVKYMDEALAAEKTGLEPWLKSRIEKECRSK